MHPMQARRAAVEQIRWIRGMNAAPPVESWAWDGEYNHGARGYHVGPVLYFAVPWSTPHASGTVLVGSDEC